MKLSEVDTALSWLEGETQFIPLELYEELKRAENRGINVPEVLRKYRKKFVRSAGQG